jgi:hypothetical protein
VFFLSVGPTDCGANVVNALRSGGASRRVLLSNIGAIFGAHVISIESHAPEARI